MFPASSALSAVKSSDKPNPGQAKRPPYNLAIAPIFAAG